MSIAPTITVICTCYNKGPWIEEVLTSILNQKTSFSFDVLVVDDGSSDGSTDTIRRIAETNPENVTAVFHEKNQGISSTWKEACPLAQGEWIARCDGDDPWIREDKLQLQMDELNKTGYLWSTTDFDMIDADGKLIEASGFERGIIPLADTYEKMLATKGFTMSSTWVARADILKECTACISPDAADDTFEVQLGLFQRTKLAYLPIATVGYRINYGSDSKPMEIADATRRFEGLCKSQLAYLEKYPEADMEEIARLLIKRDADNDVEIFTRDRRIGALEEELAAVRAERDAAKKAYEDIVNSKRWRLASVFDKKK